MPKQTNFSLSLVKNEFSGKFIVLTGICGTGKTKLAEMIVNDLTQQGIPTEYIKNPSKNFASYPPFRRYLDDIDIVNTKESDLFALTIMSLGDLFFTLRTKIIPSLQQGKWVVCDRYLVEAYVGSVDEMVAGYKLNVSDVKMIRLLSRKALKPDLGILLTNSPTTSINRITARHRSGEENIEDFDFETLFNTNIAYQKFAQANKWKIISTECDLHTAYLRISRLVKRLL